jgi:hypothetical protein
MHELRDDRAPEEIPRAIARLPLRRIAYDEFSPDGLLLAAMALKAEGAWLLY